MKKILVIDDDTRMLKLFKSYLDDIYKVIPVTNGTEALEYLKSNKPDIIFVDYLMPGLDGPHTVELIKQRDGCMDIPIVFLSGVTEKNKVKECMIHNPDGYMVKPVAREELLIKIQEICNEIG